MRHWMWLLIFFGVGLLAMPAQAQHRNDLTWGQGTCIGQPGCVTGNNVYRSKTSGTGFTNILTSAVPITAYTDSNVVGNDVWYYVVTATCKTCFPQESGFSNEIKAITPGDTPPGAPATLKVVSQ